MDDDRRHHHRRGRRGRRRDFWQAWHEERRRRWQEEGLEPDAPGFRPPFPPHKAARHWREFFHEYMGAWPEEHWAFSGRRFNPWRQGDDSFNPFVANLLSKGGGLLPLLVLQLLAQQPRYGNEIMDAIVARTNEQWSANPGAIYPLMNELEAQGLIEGEWEDPQKRTIRIYELTERGRQELQHVKAIVRPKLDAAIDVLEQLADDLNGDDTDEIV
jgi:DNA-binding PadR family transcriptional regulator